MSVPKIVVGVDGSSAAQEAVRWAAEEAQRAGTTLRLVHAFVWPLFHVPVGPSEIAPGLRAAADHVIAEAVELAGKFAPEVPVEAVVVEGFPFPVLAEESRHAGLIVVGSRGLGATLTVLIGSTTVDLIAHAHCPVIVIRAGHPGRAHGHVIAGYDGSRAAGVAVRFAIDHARRHDLDVQIVMVAERRTDDSTNRGSLPAADLMASAALAADGSRDGVFTSSRVINGHPAAELIRLSAGADLVVVGRRGRGGFRRMLIGSVSQAVLQHAECPVAVVPEPDR